MRKSSAVLTVFLALSLAGCGYNTFQTNDEQIKSSWSEVLNQYQRRADLIPNLVNTVKGFAAQEKEVLLGVTKARARVGSIQATPELVNNPEAFAKFQAAQGELSGALSRLLVVAENYPQLKSDANFRDLQAQLEGTENRIAVARNRYIKAVQEYNVTVRSFPSNLTAMVFGYKDEAQLHGREREGDLQAAQGRFRARAGQAAGSGAGAERAKWTAMSDGKGVLPGVRALLAPSCARAPRSPVPPLTARVTDQTATLTGEQKSALEQTLRPFEAQERAARSPCSSFPPPRRKRSSSTPCASRSSGNSGARTSTTARCWSWPRTTATLRIEVGYGLEGALTDATSQAHHQRDHRAALPAGGFLRRHHRRGRPDHPRDRRRAVADARQKGPRRG